MEFPDRSDVDHLIDPQPLPEFARVRYEPESVSLDDPVGAARAELDALDVDDLDDGATVAVGVGSRGIHRIDDVARAVVDDFPESATVVDDEALAFEDGEARFEDA